MKSKSLGRGISALLDDAVISSEEEHPSRIQYIPLFQCIPSKYQARRDFDQSELNELAISIKSKGVLQPILLHKIDLSTYQIIAGERRYRASKIAGLSNIPALVLDVDDKDIMEIGLIENIQRKNLNSLDEAYAYKDLIERYNYSHSDLSEIIGKSRSYISNHLRILQLPESILQLLKDEKISFGHAKMLVSINTPEKIVQQVIKDNLSVRELEAKLKERKEPNSKEDRSFEDTDLARWQNQVRNNFASINCKFYQKGSQAGKLIIEYKSLTELKQLLGI